MLTTKIIGKGRKYYNFYCIVMGDDIKECNALKEYLKIFFSKKLQIISNKRIMWMVIIYNI